MLKCLFYLDARLENELKQFVDDNSVEVLMKWNFVHHFVDCIASISYNDNVTPLGEFF